MNLLTVLLDGSASSYQGLVMMAAIIAIFYFLIIRPQQKRQKNVQKAREALKSGDKIITAGGIHGKIKEVNDTHMLVEIAEGVRVRVEKTSVFASAEDIQSK
jgi:preprotein translocase subunit YajC